MLTQTYTHAHMLPHAHHLQAVWLQKVDPKTDGAARDWVAIYDECSRILYQVCTMRDAVCAHVRVCNCACVCLRVRKKGKKGLGKRKERGRKERGRRA